MNIELNEVELHMINVAKVLSNPKRLRMLLYLKKNKYAMCSSFTRVLGISQDQTSKALKKMVACGIVQKEKVGHTWIYSLNEPEWSLAVALIGH